jgi:ribosomal protein S18 acetylase RimI-like enzyme
LTRTTRSEEIATAWPDVIRPVAGPESLRRCIAMLAEDLRSKNPEALGFLPRDTYLHAIERDRLVATLENDEPCGILLWARRRNRIKIHQTVVAEDCRRLLHATHAVEAILAHPDAQNADVLQLRVATDLPAIHFWEAIGMVKKYEVQGKLWKGRRIAVMQMRLRQPKARRRKLAAHLIDLALRRNDIRI